MSIPEKRSAISTTSRFATANAAEKWFEDNDPIGVAFEYEVLE